MKHLFKLIILFIATQYNTHLLAQQTTFNGVITIQNSGYNKNGKADYVQNAQVEGVYPKIKPTITDANGLFKLVLLNTKIPEKVRIRVQKDSFQVINPAELSIGIGESDTAHIVMAKPEDVESLRLSLYNAYKMVAESAFKQRLKEDNAELISLQNKANADEKAVQLLENNCKALNERAKNMEQIALNLANKYSLINLDDMPVNYLKAFNYVLKNELDAALMVFERLDLSGKAEFIMKAKEDKFKKGLKSDRKWDEQMRQIMANYELQADIYQLKWAFEETDSIYQLMLKYDVTNGAIYKQYGAFLLENHQLNKVKNLYEKGMNTVQLSTDKMVLLNDLGDIYRELGYYAKAEKTLMQAIELAEWEMINIKDAFEPLLVTTHYHLGKIFTDTKAFRKADTAYALALKNYQECAAKTMMGAQDSLFFATVFNSEAIQYQRQNNYKQSIKYFEKTAAIYAKNLGYTMRYKLMNVTLANLYGQLFFNQHDTLNTIKAHTEEVAIYADLMQDKPTVFENDYLVALNNLAQSYIYFNLYDKAITPLNNLVREQKRRIEAHPQQYEMDLEKTLTTLGTIYAAQKNNTLIDSIFKMRIALYETIAKTTPQYKSEMCKTYSDFGTFYKEQQKYTEAEQLYKKSIEIRREFADKEPLIYAENQQEILQTLIDLSDTALVGEIFERKILARQAAQSNYRNEMIDLQIKRIAAYEKATIKDKLSQLDAAYGKLAVYYLSVNKIKEAELIAKKQDINSAHFLIFIYGIQNKFNEAKQVLSKTEDKKIAKNRCLRWANEFYNQKIISFNIRSNIYTWFETPTSIGLQER